MPDSSSVREATAADLPVLLATARAAQDKLTCGGSAQQISGYSLTNIRERTERGELFVLEVLGSVIGSAFVEPAAPEQFPQIAAWNASAPDGGSAWFLSGLIIHPEHQRRKWGEALLGGICRQAMFASPDVLLLDCWAGNVKLRRFYADAGFDLHGVFPEAGYEVAVFKRNFLGC